MKKLIQEIKYPSNNERIFLFAGVASQAQKGYTFPRRFYF
jgi:hypothetical protein